MSERQDRKDLIDLAQSYLCLRRCPGGRITVDGYVCDHCGHDYTDDGKCGWRKHRARLAALTKGESHD